MLYKETVATTTLDLIYRLLEDDHLQDFYLVGGTSLALRIGHRLSVDIDLFCNKPFDSYLLASRLSTRYKLQGKKVLRNGIFCFINNIKVDIMSHQYPWVKPMAVIENIRMVSLEDLGAMKLHAIVLDGSRLKDFVDMYFLLEHLPLEIITSTYEQKYPDVGRSVALKALLYYIDVKPAAIDYVGPSLGFDVIAARLKEAVSNTKKVFR